MPINPAGRSRPGSSAAICHFRSMMRGERLRRLRIAWHNVLAEVGGAPLQIRSSSAAATARLILAMTSRGVPFGAQTPRQVVT